MAIEGKIVSEWKSRDIYGPQSMFIRITEDAEEVAAMVTFIKGREPHWVWSVLSDCLEVATGSELSSELARFKADLTLSELSDEPSNIRDIFSTERKRHD
jgi:hypothetical protein